MWKPWRVIQEVERIPRFMGLAYDRPHYEYPRKRRDAVCILIPFNWIVWAARKLWYRLKLTPLPEIVEAQKDGFERGKRIGVEVTYRMARVKTNTEFGEIFAYNRDDIHKELERND